MYVCYNCRKRITVKKFTEMIFCPSCSCKIVFKETPPIKKVVKTD